MLQYITGDLLLSDAEALVNTVNTVGIMGKGIALQFKNTFPDNYKRYVKACKEKTFSIGQLLVTDDDSSLH
jgi:O-acetyl-ADP-ribose deacetylase (regulator of RNase III)